MRRWDRWSGWLFALPYLILFSAFLLLPLVYGLGLSLFRWELLSSLPPRFVGAGNYQEALHSEYFWRALWATLRFVLLAVPLTVGLALLIALGIHTISPRRRAFYRAAYFLPTMITIKSQLTQPRTSEAT